MLVIPFANALAAYAVFRMVGLRRWLSFAFGLTFGMTPYVQQRMAGLGQHDRARRYASKRDCDAPVTAA